MFQLDSAVPRSQFAEAKRKFRWQEAVFLIGLIIYLATRFIALDQFPIYFFSDEAIQTLSAAEMIKNGFRDAQGQIPIYFENGGQFNLSLSVWLQTLVAPFAPSVGLTRGLSALLTLIFPLTLGLALRDYLKIKYWWIAPFVVSVLPAWFLHSRTAFETALGTALYCAFLYYYLRYRMLNRDFLPITLLFGSFTFYAYAPLQLVVVVTGLLILIIDWPYHFKDKKIPWLGFITLLVLALPYIVFRLRHADSLSRHLTILQSYWISRISFGEKLKTFLSYYAKGLDPRYWFLPNQGDLIRHQMKNMAHIPLLLSPFIGLGLLKTLSKLKDPAWRTVLIAFVATPVGAALVGIAITRNLVSLVPFAFLACLGLDAHINWLGKTKPKAILTLILVLLLLLGSCGWMTYDAVTNGSTWYQDYGLYGMQWGGKELSDEIQSFQRDHPDAKVIVSPTWANNTDVILRFFLGDPLPVEVNSINDWALNQKELNKNMVFVMPPEEYEKASRDKKFTDLEVIQSLNWPNGKTGFYFVTLSYADNASDLFESEAAERAKPEQELLRLFDQDVAVPHSKLDIGHITNAFDGNTNTLIRGLEANPLFIQLNFEKPVRISGLRVLVGLPPAALFAEISPVDHQQTLRFSRQSFGFDQNDWIEINFGGTYSVEKINIWLQENTDLSHPHIHIWEIEIIE